MLAFIARHTVLNFNDRKKRNRQIMKYFKIALAVLIISLISCEKDEELARNSTDIVPLKVGNRWFYTTYLYEDSQEAKYETSSISVDKQIDLTIRGKKIETFQIKNTTGDLYTNKFVGNTSDGYTEYGLILDFDHMFQYSGGMEFVFIGENDTLIYNSLVAKYPIQANENWETENSYSYIDYDEASNVRTIEIKVDTVEIKCIETNKTIDTDIGSFNCIGYRYGDNDYYSINYYSVGYGMIKSEFYENGGIEGYRILTDINLK